MRRLGEAGSLESVKPDLDRFKSFLDKLLSEKVLAVLPPNIDTDVESQVSSFFTFLDSEILNYSDVSQRDYKISRIRNEVGSRLISLEKYSIYFDVLPEERTASTDFDKKAADIAAERGKEISELKELRDSLKTQSAQFAPATTLASELVSRGVEIQDALGKIQEFAKANEKTIEALLRQNATSFAQKAQEHLSYTKDFVPIWILKRATFWGLNMWRQPAWYIGSIIWLWSGMIFGGIVLSIVFYFIVFAEELSIENVILRVSALVVPSYFAVLFVSQFLQQKRLYEIYKFKDIALQTMVMLRTQFGDDYDSRRDLMQKSLTVIFTEPATKEENKINKQLVSELLRLIREK